MALSEAEKAQIEAIAYTCDHNFAYYSLILGEPFFREGFLFFFDGKLLSINTYFFDSEYAPSLAKKREAFREIIEYFKPEAIYIWGPHFHEELFSLPDGWTRYNIAEPREFNRDIVLILRGYGYERVPYNYRSLDYTNKNSIKVVIQTGNQFTASHIALLEDFVTYYDLDLFDRIFYSILPTWLITSNGLIFEVWQDSQLCGYVVLDLSMHSLPICLGCFSLRTIPDVIDVLLNAMINYCIEREFPKVVLGYSYREELYKYKIKWGKCLVQKGFWKSILYYTESPISPKRYPWMLRGLIRN